MIDKLRAAEVEMGNIINATNIIKETISTVHGELEYMKFIVLFSEKIMLNVKQGEVDEMTHQSNTIDLIYCIDMLNIDITLKI